MKKVKAKEQYKYNNFVDIIRERNQQTPQDEVFTFKNENSIEKDRIINYAELDLLARKIATQLQDCAKIGQRALILLKPGFDYIAALFGCFYTGIIAIPVYTPNFGQLKSGLSRLEAIIRDSKASIIITSDESILVVQDILINKGINKSIACFTIENLSLVDADMWKPVNIHGDNIALLQYTSGSTSEPKGVILTHSNLVTNTSLICEAFNMYQEGRVVSWLPPYHDMGLIGGILSPIYSQYPLTLLSPLAFIQDPLCWLKIISQQKATISGAPNFAYELCVKKMLLRPVNSLDLSSWNIAFCGAEFIKPQTIERFSNVFSQFGFQKKAFSACYGLAESTLMVTSSELANARLRIESFDTVSLKAKHAVLSKENDKKLTQMIVSCGSVIPGHKIIIVDPDSKEILKDLQIGEIWIHGASVAKGYWEKLQISSDIFKATPKQSYDNKKWLRTGDIGFIYESELFITGRIKELIIVNGQNYYPQDIEVLVEKINEDFSLCASAAFAVQKNNIDQVILVQEVIKKYNTDRLEHIALKICQQATNILGISISEIIFVPRNTLPKTTSGKIQRNLIKSYYTRKQLNVTLIYRNKKKSILKNSKMRVAATESKRKIKEMILSLIKHYLARIYPSTTIALHSNYITDFGLDSVQIVELKNYIEEHLLVSLDIKTFFMNVPIKTLIESIVNDIKPAKKEQQGNGYIAINKDFLIDEVVDPGQKSIYYACIFNHKSSAYTISRAISISKKIKFDILQKSFRAIVKNYPDLSCTFFIKGDNIYKKFNNYPIDKIIEKIDIVFDDDNSLKDYIAGKLSTPIDLGKGPLIKFYLIETNTEKNIILFKMHHIISDFWSLTEIFYDLDRAYKLYQSGEAVSNDVISKGICQSYYSADYKDYLSSDSYRRDRLFWISQFKNIDITQRLRNPKLGKNINTYQFEIDEEIYRKVKDLSKTIKLTPFIVLLTAYQVAIAGLIQRNSIITGTPVALRDKLSFKKYIGYCVNVLPVITYVNSQDNFIYTLWQVKDTVEMIRQHKMFPFVNIMDDLRLARDPEYLPLFDTLFIYQSSHTIQRSEYNAIAANLNDIGIKIFDEYASSISIQPSDILSEITFTISPLNNRYYCNIAYDANLYNNSLIYKFSLKYKSILKEINVNGDLNILTSEQRKIREEVNSTSRIFQNENKRLDDLFYEKAMSTPNAIAIISGSNVVTYSQLLNYVNNLATNLIANDIESNELIAIVMDKSIEQIVSCLAIMAAGCAYLPIDVAYPNEKIKELLKIGRIKRVLTRNEFYNRINQISQETSEMLATISVDEAINHPSNCISHTNLKLKRKNCDLAYVIFTSGSTGKPKGVMIEHRQVVNTILDINERFNITSHDKVLGLSNLDFDLSVYDIFGLLAAGGTIVLPSETEKKEPKAWVSLINKHKITIWNSVPMFMQMLVEYVSSSLKIESQLYNTLRLVLLSGDWIPLDLPMQVKSLLIKEQHLSNTLEIVSLGGATECSIWSNCFVIKDIDTRWKSIPYGKPLSNQYFDILDANMLPCPDGVPGNLYIGGKGVARGYWDDEEKTAENFISHPKIHEKIYRTGDLAQYLPDGNVEFLGREDNQVKINGYRIELGDIQSKIKNYQGVKNAIATIWKGKLRNQLLVYLIVANKLSSSEKEIFKKQIQAYLSSYLPNYMLPEQYIFIDQIPLNRNGKLDIKQLPLPNFSKIKNRKKEPKTIFQKKLAEIWKTILDIKEVHIDDNFFKLGGNSLLIVKMNNEIAKELNINLDVMTVFKNQTIELLEEFIENEYQHKPMDYIKRRERVLNKVVD